MLAHSTCLDTCSERRTPLLNRAPSAAQTRRPSRTGSCLLGLALLCLTAAPSTAQAVESSVQRRDYAFVTYFEWADDALPRGTIIRERWRQPLRSTYELFDAEGELLASATTRLFNLGVIFPWARTLDIADAHSETRYTLGGVWVTWESAVFKLTHHTGGRVVDLRMDLKQSGFVVTYPNRPRSVVARFYRNQISDQNYERWDYVAPESSDVPPYVWPILAAFFADIW